MQFIFPSNFNIVNKFVTVWEELLRILLFEAVVVSLMTMTQIILNKTKPLILTWERLHNNDDHTSTDFTFIGMIHNEVLE